MLAGADFNIAVASRGLTAFNLGGEVGAIAAALPIGKLGSKPVLLASAGGAILTAMWLRIIPFNIADPSTLFVGQANAGSSMRCNQACSLWRRMSM